MLYALHEMRRNLLLPWSLAARAGQEWFSNPFSPFAYLPSSRRVAAGAELFHRLTQNYERPAFGLDSTTICGQAVPVRESVAVDKPFCKLLHFERVFPPGEDASMRDPVVLLVAPLSGHFATLLRDTVRTL